MWESLLLPTLNSKTQPKTQGRFFFFMITVLHLIGVAGDFIKHSSVLINVLRYQVPYTIIYIIEGTSFRNLNEIIKDISSSVSYS